MNKLKLLTSAALIFASFQASAAGLLPTLPSLAGLTTITSGITPIIFGLAPITTGLGPVTGVLTVITTTGLAPITAITGQTLAPVVNDLLPPLLGL